MKSNNYSINDVIIKNSLTVDEFFKQRNSLFIDIVKPIYEYYENYLSERGEIDFSDMINKASKLIANGKLKRKFSYIIIDEFQDISIGRYQLVKSIKTSNPSCKLFSVGDDWQSIYRFSGSDIALFKEFENYFGYTVKSKIETTYRFHNPLINLSSDFIQKNPNQARKELHGTSHTKSTKYKIQYSISENQNDTIEVQKIFNYLISNDEEISSKENFILGRYGFDINRLSSQNGLSIIVREFEKNSNEIIREYSYTEDKWKHLKENEKIIVAYKKSVFEKVLTMEAEYLTVHKAKGLEADNIIILNCNSGKHGFPSEMSDDQVLNLLLSEADQFENGEERRLFYVAMTRAKENVYFVADSSFKSKFITELEVEDGLSPNKKCPICKTADVVLRKEGTSRNGNRYKFYGCTNYLYGCDYTTTEWINN
jgi:DNA helicase-4